MSVTETASGMTLRPRVAQRNSIRNSLNSVGKALADVINKEGLERGSRRGRDTASKRSSAVGVAPRTSVGSDAKSAVHKGSETPETKTITRQTRRSSVVPRQSISAQDEQGVKVTADTAIAPQPSVITRSSSLRPRTVPGSSALPKYRPKSVIIDPASKSPSPSPSPSAAAAETSKTPSFTDEESENTMKIDMRGKGPSLPGKSPSITSLPQKPVAVNLSSAINVTPTKPGRSSGKVIPSPERHSPSPTLKLAKSTVSRPSQSPTMMRPPSSSSSSSTPRTPKTPSSLKTALGLNRAGRERSNGSPSPLRGSVRLPESPLSHRSLKSMKSRSPVFNIKASSSPSTPIPCRYPEDNSSDDSFEADDVEMLLAPVAALTAPTPAVPRIQVTRTIAKSQVQTPTRSNSGLPARSQLSYLSPVPASADNSPSALKRPQGYERGSILSWEQLANESSKTMGEDEVNTMLGDIPAPFSSDGSARTTPRNSYSDIPESPILDHLASPGEFGSLSQILLPDVTPSPAPCRAHNQMFANAAKESGAGDASAATLLRLRLASEESLSRERLERLQQLEAQLHALKEARDRDTQELAKQITVLEERLHVDMEVRERTRNEQQVYLSSLEEQLEQASMLRDQAISVAVSEAKEAARKQQERNFEVSQRRWQIANVAQGVSSEWISVRHLAESELEFVRSSREMLAVLLAGLDPSHR